MISSWFWTYSRLFAGCLEIRVQQEKVAADFRKLELLPAGKPVVT